MLLHSINETELVKGEIIKRPSRHIKSPYVADVMINNNISLLAHTPSLGCCGLSDKGSTVMIEKAPENKKTKTDGKVQISIFEERNNIQYIGINPKLSEILVEKSLQMNCFQHLKDIKSFKREKTIKTSRFDFIGVDKHGNPFILEVKSARKDTVSPRALKHIKELKTIKLESPSTRCILCFVIQRTDVCVFQPSKVDPIYREAVQDAWLHGVEIFTLQVKWNEQGKAYFHSSILPVCLFDEEGPQLLNHEKHIQDCNV